MDSAQAILYILGVILLTLAASGASLPRVAFGLAVALFAYAILPMF